jgi:hypothetical protein
VQSTLKWDRRFESSFLHQRVNCEPSSALPPAPLTDVVAAGKQIVLIATFYHQQERTKIMRKIIPTVAFAMAVSTAALAPQRRQ